MLDYCDGEGNRPSRWGKTPVGTMHKFTAVGQENKAKLNRSPRVTTKIEKKMRGPKEKGRKSFAVSEGGCLCQKRAETKNSGHRGRGCTDAAYREETNENKNGETSGARGETRT